MTDGDERKPMANITPFGLRMQPDLKARVEASAAEHNRSMNAEIVACLEWALGGADVEMAVMRTHLAHAQADVAMRDLDIARLRERLEPRSRLQQVLTLYVSNTLQEHLQAKFDPSKRRSLEDIVVDVLREAVGNYALTLDEISTEIQKIRYQIETRVDRQEARRRQIAYDEQDLIELKARLIQLEAERAAADVGDDVPE